MKAIGTYGGYEIVKRGRFRIVYEIRNSDKVQASYNDLADLYDAIDRRERCLTAILYEDTSKPQYEAA